jgi:hypothetical protein
MLLSKVIKCIIEKTEQVTALGERHIEMNKQMKRTTVYWARWVTMLPALIGAVLAMFVAVYYWTPIKIFYVWHQAAVGFLFAVIWMVLTFLLAPSHKILACVVSLPVGACLAWFLLGETNWPDYSGVTRIQTYITWSGGVLTLILLCVIRRKRNIPITPIDREA